MDNTRDLCEVTHSTRTSQTGDGQRGAGIRHSPTRPAARQAWSTAHGNAS
ncbi:hypothetical protein [Nitratidesulfovibrio vulgaris]|nr:hypothetical protein [Nitratidesulfovibrio vulgaris]WCB45527.1 hypothetical protein PH214_10630 [Nitratidesulfovibrio vulgaris]